MKDRTERKLEAAAGADSGLEARTAAEATSELDLEALTSLTEELIVTARPAVERRGLAFARRRTRPGVDPLDEVKWELRIASLQDSGGKTIFEQKDVEVPRNWSQMATNVVVQKYFRGGVGTPQRETSVRQLVSRVADTIAGWGRDQGAFASPEDAETFRAELSWLLVHQHAAFNSPVWFNVGVEETPQCSACFINSVTDSMESILDLAKTEGLLFKYGSGTGTNLSPLRSSKEKLSTGGEASGPVSFMKGYDAFAGVIKSGGKTRRAAKMVMLNSDHPDIVDFINCKVEEERKAWALIDAGYDGSFNGVAYGSVFFQNSNNSVRASDEFMQAIVDDRTWTTKAVKDGRPMQTYRARELMRMIAEGTHVCGDPGLQFDTTINDWHTCPATDRIHGSNPCSEYMFLNDSACNLASLNLMKFRRQDGEFDIEGFRHAVDTLLTAMEILVDGSSYPRASIAENSRRFRPLGLGFANLGALLMSRSLPYDSDAGRDYAAALTSLMCGQAYLTSARMAERFGAFEGYAANREPMLRVIQKHRSHINGINAHRVPEDLLAAVREVWSEAYTVGYDYGYRNAQVTVLAPTGTIGFMLDCDTTGVEPDIALIKYKKLVGGGVLKIVNNTVPEALERLGYSDDERRAILAHLEEQETIEGAPGLKEEHLPVFDCAFRPTQGKRSIHYKGHIRMMAAVQPFLSGAISKTVNMPQSATVEEIAEAYLEAWKLGLKAVAIYRDGSKRTQPLNTGDKKPESPVAAARVPTPEETRQAPPAPHRIRLPDERTAVTHKFSIGGHEGYITVGLYPNGQPGEMFIAMAKEGSVVSGLMDSFATACSIMLQYGVPLDVLITKFSHSRFEPSGFTTNPEIPMAKSIMDYLFRWMDLKFGKSRRPAADAPEYDTGLGPDPAYAVEPSIRITMEDGQGSVFEKEMDAPPCPECGMIMVRNGACYKCLNCAATSGCS
ncbi:MAG: vitamin B12-dependent ribonucleotide reductase [Candidatus Latescibacteria bacterium]|nr:vitamin B12-dependent ribonucleotide reductase [Candidatus Latescibacterota bacterium]